MKEDSLQNDETEKLISDSLPEHMAIIMDGNGRWAQEMGLSRIEGHRKGAKALDDLIDEILKLKIPYISLFVFSTENWKRPKTEIAGLFEILNFYLKKKIKQMQAKGICIKVSGELDKIPEKSKILMEDAVEKTKNCNQLVANFCLNYGSRDEVLRAVQKTMNQRFQGGDIQRIHKKVTWEEFSNNLYTASFPDIDLVIRTAGEHRLSNFLLLQSAYAELYFCDNFWPDFDKHELHKALIWYQQRVRKFGGLSNQKRKDNKL